VIPITTCHYVNTNLKTEISLNNAEKTAATELKTTLPLVAYFGETEASFLHRNYSFRNERSGNRSKNNNMKSTYLLRYDAV
jgi:hypothetical protein